MESTENFDCCHPFLRSSSCSGRKYDAKIDNFDPVLDDYFDRNLLISVRMALKLSENEGSDDSNRPRMWPFELRIM